MKIPLLPKHQNKEKEERELVRRIVRRFSRENACLNLGWYTTKEDIDKRRSEVLSYKNSRKTIDISEFISRIRNLFKQIKYFLQR